MEKEIRWLLEEKYPEINPLDLNGASHGKTSANFYKDIERLKAGEPIDYIIGFSDFLGCKIDLSKKPLIPRPETEFWVQEAIAKMNNPSIRFAHLRQNLRILDIFAGSGCIGIAIMEKMKNTEVVFAEKNPVFVKQIQINCKINKIPKIRYKIIESDIFSKISGNFDYIFANPPYISAKRKNKIQTSVLKYEPEMALLGGIDGLFHIRKFLISAKDFLKPKGKVYMEFDSRQKRAIAKIIKKFGYKKYQFYEDQYGKSRYVVIEYNNGIVV